MVKISKSKIAMKLSIKITIVVIIGIILFGITLLLSSKFSSKEIGGRFIPLTPMSLKCPEDDWICTPIMELKKGESKTYEIFVANRGDSATPTTFNIKLYDGATEITNGEISSPTSTDCGSVKVVYYTQGIGIPSGNSASFPIIISANKVKKACSFTAVVQTNAIGGVIYKTPLIIRVD